MKKSIIAITAITFLFAVAGESAANTCTGGEHRIYSHGSATTGTRIIDRTEVQNAYAEDPVTSAYWRTSYVKAYRRALSDYSRQANALGGCRLLYPREQFSSFGFCFSGDCQIGPHSGIYGTTLFAATKYELNNSDTYYYISTERGYFADSLADVQTAAQEWADEKLASPKAGYSITSVTLGHSVVCGCSSSASPSPTPAPSAW